MGGSGGAIGEEGIFLRLGPAARELGHQLGIDIGGRHLKDGIRRLARVAPETFTDGADGDFGLAGIELHLAAQESARRADAQGHIGVGDGGLGAAAVVAGGAGKGTGAARTHLQHPSASSQAMSCRRADGRDIHGGSSGEIAHGVLGGRDLTIDHGDVDAGAAHVEGDQLVVADHAPMKAAPMTPEAGPGERLHRRRRPPPRSSPCRIWWKIRQVMPAVGGLLGQGIEVAAHPPADIGVDDADQQRFALALLRPDLRGADIDVGKARLDPFLGQALMPVMTIGMEEADRDVLRPWSISPLAWRARLPRSAASARCRPGRAAPPPPPRRRGTRGWGPRHEDHWFLESRRRLSSRISRKPAVVMTRPGAIALEQRVHRQGRAMGEIDDPADRRHGAPAGAGCLSGSPPPARGCRRS